MLDLDPEAREALIMYFLWDLADREQDPDPDAEQLAADAVMRRAFGAVLEALGEELPAEGACQEALRSREA